MATTLAKSVVRKDPRSNLVVTMAPEGLYIREHRRRKAFGPIPWGALYLEAVRRTLDAEKREKAKAKKAKKTAARRGLL